MNALSGLADECVAWVNADALESAEKYVAFLAVLDRDKQLAVVRQLTDLVAGAAGDPTLTDRTWVLLTEAVEGGWGLHGQANTNDELVAAARAQIAEIQGGS